YVFPVSGKGLWSTIYGYLALEPDGVTLKGISFYKHGETPGLGGEIEARWFQQNFQGKKIYDVTSQTLRPVRVAKGRAADHVRGRDLEFVVDGISGATMTGNGVTEMLDHGLRVYDPYFQKVRQSQAPSL
ncbi:MAG TPA: NADH:ubiquinone reductase (Na(+)-transporting) subunit C, partial [Candidatus Bathyarchaeia archaeon]|nr:NADH:ubiquinone reductase (Na(+)-transporting) subunit C [Candidatus Bathyarchaeia archaeon]